MVITPSGQSGPNAVLHVVEVYKQEQGTAPILLHNTVEETVKAWA